MTEAERRVWFKLRNHRFNGFSFRRQMVIGPCIADFVCLSARLIIELDGGQHNSLRQDYDRRRDDWLREQQFAVLKIWNREVFENLDGVIERIASTLVSPPPSLALPRKGGGDKPAVGER
jgi:very-short-patch-repair endonuclease